MTPYVECQRIIVGWMLLLAESRSGRRRLRRLRARYADGLKRLTSYDRRIFKEEIHLPVNEEWIEEMAVKAILEQIDVSARLLKIRNLLGLPLYPQAPYGFEEHLRHYGTGRNGLRTERVAQPGQLKPGDILATGDHVLSLPREGGNGAVLVHLSGGRYGSWISLPGRIPVALLAEADPVPFGLRTRFK